VYFSQDSATISVKLPTIFSKLGISNKFDMFKDLKDVITFLMNDFSSSLPLIIDLLTELIFSSIVRIAIVNSTWSEVRCQFGWIIWLSSSSKPLRRNIKSKTEFELLELSVYFVGNWLAEVNKLKSKKSAIIRRLLLIVEWCRKVESYKLSGMLKSPVIISIFQILTSVFLRYFKAKWEESE